MAVADVGPREIGVGSDPQDLRDLIRHARAHPALKYDRTSTGVSFERWLEQIPHGQARLESSVRRHDAQVGVELVRPSSVNVVDLIQPQAVGILYRGSSATHVLESRTDSDHVPDRLHQRDAEVMGNQVLHLRRGRSRRDARVSVVR